MLTEQQVDQYHQDGYVIPDFRLDDDTIDSISRAHDRLLVSHPEFVDYCPALLAFDTGFLNYARIPEILDIVEQLIGGNFALWNSSFFAKPAQQGTRTPWHQDGEYWPIRPHATCSVWIAVDDSNKENGCLRVLPGSHRAKVLLPHEINNSSDVSLPLQIKQENFDESAAVDVVLERGQISLHDVFLAHASEPNTSDKPRRGMTLRYMPTSSVYDREIARRSNTPRLLNMAERTLYLMRGTDLSGKNDFSVRS